jgi:hypothetical protein
MPGSIQLGLPAFIGRYPHVCFVCVCMCVKQTYSVSSSKSAMPLLDKGKSEKNAGLGSQGWGFLLIPLCLC